MDNVTLTICAAATSAGNPRQQLRASSFDKASQTPSLEMIIRPPAVNSYMNIHRWR